MLLASRDGFLAVGLGRSGCEGDGLFWRFFFGAIVSLFGFGGATRVQVKPSNLELLATASQMRFCLDTRAEVGVSVSMMAPGRGVFIASVWGVARGRACGGLAMAALVGRAIVVLRWAAVAFAVQRGGVLEARVTRRHAQWPRLRSQVAEPRSQNPGRRTQVAEPRSLGRHRQRRADRANQGRGHGQGRDQGRARAGPGPVADESDAFLAVKWEMEMDLPPTWLVPPSESTKLKIGLVQTSGFRIQLDEFILFHNPITAL
jgi:hypothetical protein